MKTQLIKLKDKFILVSDEEIRPDEPYINNGIIFYADSKFDEGNNPNNSNPRVTDHNFKIIAGIPELPSIDFSSLSEEDCKKIEWVNVEKLANEKYQKQSDNPPYTIITPKNKILGFIEGFKTNQSLNEKKYTEKDLAHVVEYMLKNTISTELKTELEINFQKGVFVLSEYMKRIIQSLSQPKVFDVEIACEIFFDICPDIGDVRANYRPKITNNSIRILKVL